MRSSIHRADSVIKVKAGIFALLFVPILGASQLLPPACAALAATATPIQTGGGSGGAVYSVKDPSYPSIERLANYDYNNGFAAGGDTPGSGQGAGADGLASGASVLSISGSVRGGEDAAVVGGTAENPAGHMGGGAGLVYSNSGGKVTVQQGASVAGGSGAYTSGGGAGMITVYGGEVENRGTITGGSVWNNGVFTTENSGGGGAGLFMAGADTNGTISGDSSGGTLINFGTIQGGAGGSLSRESTDNGIGLNIRAVAGSGGNGVSANNAYIHNRSGAFILGGDGGGNSHTTGTNGNTPGAGDAGSGVQLYSKDSGLRSTVINDGIIRGGNGGLVSNSSDHRAGMGGQGIAVYGEHGYIFNTGLIEGGLSGNKSSSLPGDGIRVLGDFNYIVNAGSIVAGQHVSSMLVSAPAVSFRSGNNVLELRQGWNFDGSVIGTALAQNTLALGGPEIDDETFDQSVIRPNGSGSGPYIFRDLDFYAKVGEATWTLTGTPANNSPNPAHQVRWDVYGGTLKVNGAIAGSEVFEGVLEPGNAAAQLGAVTVYGAGGSGSGYGFFSGRPHTGGALVLGRGGNATTVELRSGSSIHAYSDNVYLEADDSFTAANGVSTQIKGGGWEDGKIYRLLHSNNNPNAIGSDFSGDGVRYSTVG